MAGHKFRTSGDGFDPIPRKKKSENQHIRKPKFMILSDEYKSLSACSKAIMECMQIRHYTNYYTGFGRDQAIKETGYQHTTVAKAFSELMQKRFLVLQANYNHLKGKTRTWEMTWMSYNGKPPRDLWKG